MSLSRVKHTATPYESVWVLFPHVVSINFPVTIFVVIAPKIVDDLVQVSCQASVITYPGRDLNASPSCHTQSPL